RDALTAAIDRIEGRAESPTPISENHSYGEVYGLLAPDDLAELLPAEMSGVADTIRRVVRDAELHVDAMSDVNMVASVHGPDPRALDDLGKTLGGALALGRAGARTQDDGTLSELLEHARVRRYGGSFD